MPESYDDEDFLFDLLDRRSPQISPRLPDITPRHRARSAQQPTTTTVQHKGRSVASIRAKQPPAGSGEVEERQLKGGGTVSQAEKGRTNLLEQQPVLGNGRKKAVAVRGRRKRPRGKHLAGPSSRLQGHV